MRQPEEMGWYSVEGEDGFPRAVHGIKSRMGDAKEISEAQAKQISADVRARQPKRSAATRTEDGTVSVDLTSLQNQLDAHAKMLVEQAHTLDAHEGKINATQASVTEYLQSVKAGRPG